MLTRFPGPSEQILRVEASLMVGRSSWCLLVAAFALLVPVLTGGQDAPSGRSAADFLFRRAPSAQISRGPTIHPYRPPITPPGAFGFPQFLRAAGMIFSGTVTHIERRPARAGQSVETVAVTFHVESSLRGATPGREVTITQWIGLWSSGQRYRMGERVVLFLYPNSKLGLTSTVGGSLGRFAVDRAGWVLLTAQHLAAFRGDPVLGGKSRARFGDFALAVGHAGEEE